MRGAILRPVQGRERVARFFAGLVAKTDLTGLVPGIEIVNHGRALVGRDATGVRFGIQIEVDGERIAVIRNVVNPEKLALRYVD